MAELGGKLSNFVGRVLKAKKTPMIFKFAEVTMPKGRGKKGGETNRKRKASVTVDKWLPNPSFTKQEVWSPPVSQSLTAYAHPPPPILPPSMQLNSPISFNTSPWVFDQR